MKKIFAANWKLNKAPSDARKFVQEFQKLTGGDSFYDGKDVLIFPQAFSLEAVSDESKNTQIKFGPQNIYSEKSGAFTGENSGEVAKMMGAEFILIGHSERRQIFQESDENLNAKTKLVQSLNLTPVFCIGET
ncbi:MAG: triosephosphate isomerase, partial [Bdellovibrio sp.]|nr:triosephosphate isomerase [Bdellovibrio sp.]